jgi:hypothetical protein
MPRKRDAFSKTANVRYITDVSGMSAVVMQMKRVFLNPEVSRYAYLENNLYFYAAVF